MEFWIESHDNILTMQYKTFMENLHRPCSKSWTIYKKDGTFAKKHLVTWRKWNTLISMALLLIPRISSNSTFLVAQPLELIAEELRRVPFIYLKLCSREMKIGANQRISIEYTQGWVASMFMHCVPNK